MASSHSLLHVLGKHTSLHLRRYPSLEVERTCFGCVRSFSYYDVMQLTCLLQYHDTFWLLRQMFFLLLPIMIHSLPATPPLDALASIKKLGSTMEMLGRRTTLLKLLHATTMREPSLRAAADRWWSKQKTEGQWVRQDEGVQRAAEKLGFGFVRDGDAGTLAQKAKLSTDALLGMVAS